MEGTRDYAIFMLDPQGRVVSWNSGAEHIKGYPAEEIMGKDFCCSYSAEAREAGVPRQLLNRAATEGRVENAGWRVRNDGSQFRADVVITALRDNSGRLRGFSKVARDMTEHHQLDQARLAAEVLAEGVSGQTVTAWRKALGVPATTEGTSASPWCSASRFNCKCKPRRLVRAKRQLRTAPDS